jgi:hypothetical protein
MKSLYHSQLSPFFSNFCLSKIPLSLSIIKFSAKIPPKKKKQTRFFLCQLVNQTSEGAYYNHSHPLPSTSFTHTIAYYSHFRVPITFPFFHPPRLSRMVSLRDSRRVGGTKPPPKAVAASVGRGLLEKRTSFGAWGPHGPSLVV